MNWDRAKSMLNAFGELNKSLQVQELKTMGNKADEYKFVVAYYFKELKDRKSVVLMDKFGIHDGDSRYEFELEIINEIKRSGLLFRNIWNEFHHNFYDELINGPVNGVVLAMRFRCDDFGVIFEKLYKCQVLETQFLKDNLELVTGKLLGGSSLDDFGLKICDQLQNDIYQHLQMEIDSGKYDDREGFQPFYSNNSLQSAVAKRNDLSAYKWLCLRGTCDQYYILNQLFAFYERGAITNYGDILEYKMKIDLGTFERFINSNKLIGREVFVFLSNFTSLVPPDILRIVDVKMADYLAPFLRNKCVISLPKGCYEIDLRDEQIFLQGEHDDNSKNLIELNRSKSLMDRHRKNEKLLVKLLDYDCIKRSIIKNFNPFNYTIETSLQIIKKYKIEGWSFYSYCLANVEYLKSLFLDYYISGQSIPEEIIECESTCEKPAETDAVVYKSLERVYMFSSVLVLELNLTFLTADVFRSIIGLNDALDLKIYLFLKKENFELLKDLVGCFRKTPDSKLTNLMKGKKIALQDLRCYLSYDIDFTMYEIEVFFELYESGVDENGMRILLQYENDEDSFKSFQFLLRHGIEDVFKYFNKENDLIYNYLRDSDLKLCFEYIKGHERYKSIFFKSIDASMCCLEEARIAYELLDRTLIVDNNVVLPNNENMAENENILTYTKCDSAVTCRLRKAVNTEDGNLYYKCIYNDITGLIAQHREDDIFYILSYIRPKDVQPYINDLFGHDNRIIKIHLRDRFYTFVIMQQIECVLNERKNEDHMVLILENVEKIRLPTLLRLYHHQNKQISDLSLQKLKKLKILNKNLSDVRLKIINYLTDKNQGNSFIDNIVFTSELDKESLEICILLVKKSRNMILAEKLLCLTKQKNICEYLKDVLCVLNGELIIKYVNELKYMLNKDDLIVFVREKMRSVCLENAKLVVKILEIMDMDVNVVISREEIAEFENVVARKHDLSFGTAGERKSGAKNDRLETSVLYEEFFENIDNMRNLTDNKIVNKLFVLAAYAPVLPSFHRYIGDMLNLVFSEFYFENKISVMCLTSIIENTSDFTWYILQFLKNIASKTSSNNKQRILEIVDLIYNKCLSSANASMKTQLLPKTEIERQREEEDMFTEVLFLTFVLKNDSNTVIAKEFSKFFGRIYGPKNIKKYFGEIVRNLNHFYCVNAADEIIMKYRVELVDCISSLSNEFLIRCLHNGFMTKEIIRLAFEDQKTKVIRHILENEKDKIELAEIVETSNFHKNIHLFDDETLIRMFFINYDRDIIKFVGNTDILYIHFLELAICKKGGSEDNQKFFREYSALKKEMILNLSPTRQVEELLLRSDRAMITDYLMYQEVVVDHGNLKTLISKISEDCVFLLGKISVNYLLFLNINLIITYLGKEHFSTFKERLSEVTDQRNAALYCLRCYLDANLRPGVIYCLRKINYHSIDDECDVLRYYVGNLLKTSY